MEKTAHILTGIVRKAIQGDEDAQAMLYAQFSRKMFSICVRMTGNRSDAEDILQDSFITAFRNLPQLKDVQLFEAWLRKIVVNESIRQVKRRIRWEPVVEDGVEDVDGKDEPWLQQIGFELIHEEIKLLPEGCREVFNLYVIEDYSHQQIANALEISVSTSKSQYFRTRQLLRERLLKHILKHG